MQKGVSETAALAAFIHCRISSKALKLICASAYSWEEAYALPIREFVGLGLLKNDIDKLTQRSENLLGRIVRKIQEQNLQLISIGSKKYSVLLEEIACPPFAIFVRGSHKILNAHLPIAVVGTRTITEYGRRVLKQIIPALVQAGATIISGLAYGVDSFAQQIAVDHGGRCIGVLASGVDIVTPNGSFSLARKILDTEGALISEQPLGCMPLPSFFHIRNRIIAGLAKATIVVEAKKISGSLITANYALDEGREVIAVPGDVFLPNQQGTNKLIAKGAYPVISAENLLEKLMINNDIFSKPEPVLIFSSKQEKLIYETLSEPRSLDDLSRSTKLPISQINQLLTLMELKSMVRNMGGARFVRA